MMKKYLLSFAVLLMGTALFTACDDDDTKPTPVPVSVSEGVFVVCGGNQSSSIDGSLTYIDYATSAASQNVFFNNNGRKLGLTVNDAIVYGDKMYIVVSEENSVEVVDRKTLRSIKRISTTSLMGDKEGVNPRHIAAADGKVYVTTYGASQVSYNEYYSVTGTSGNGYVAAIDTVTFALNKTYAAGSYPEGLAVTSGAIIVANSDYSAGLRPSISVIDLKTGVDTPITDENIRNPQRIAVAGSVIYYLDWGLYDENWMQVNAGVYRINGTSVRSIIANATNWACADTKIYTYCAPYGQSTVEYKVHDIQSGSTSTLSVGTDIFSPAAIGVDPIKGNVFIASYQENPDRPGRAGYSLPAYVVEYDANGTKLNKYDCGVGPNAIVFNTGVEYVQL